MDGLRFDFGEHVIQLDGQAGWLVGGEASAVGPGREQVRLATSASKIRS
jgi:hypothetical protein